MPVGFSSRSLTTWLRRTGTPTALLDAAGRPLWANPAFERWSGLSTAELVRTLLGPAAGPDAPIGLLSGALADRAAETMAWRVGPGGLQRFIATIAPLRDSDETAYWLTIEPEPRDLPDSQPSVDGVSADPAWDRLAWEARFADGLPPLLAGNSDAAAQLRAQAELARGGEHCVLLCGAAPGGLRRVAEWIAAGETLPLGPPLASWLLDPELLQSSVAGFLKRQADDGDEAAACFVLLELDKLAADAQAELLGLLELPEIRLRIVATLVSASAATATRPEEVRERLWRRLAVQQLYVPPLAERLEDLPAIAEAICRAASRTSGREVAGVRREALERISLVPFPDDVDGLEALLGAAAATASGSWIEGRDLPPRVEHAVSAARHPPREVERLDLDATLTQVERELIQRALVAAGGNRAAAARLLNVSRPRLLRRIEQLGDVSEE